MTWQHHLFIFYRRDGVPQGDLAGANIFLPPKRAHRMRRRDSLLIYLHQEGNAPLSGREQRALLEKLSARYFSLGGSVTAALKELTSALNTYFLNRNRKLSGQGKHAIGWLALGVWRSDTLYLALSGPLHALALGEETRHYHAPQISGRGLGISRSPRVYFASATVQPGDVLLVTPHLPEAWQHTLQPDAHRKISPLLRRIGTYNGDNLESVVVQTRPGKGDVRRTVLSDNKAMGSITTEARETEEPAPGEPSPASQTEQIESAPPARPPDVPPPSKPAKPPQPRQRPAAQPPAPSTRPATPPNAQPAPAQASQSSQEKTSRPAADTGKNTSKPPSGPSVFSRVGEHLRQGLARVWQTGEKALGFVGHAVGRGLATSADEVFSLPRSFMALSAIAVPLIVVTASVVVFVRRGRLQQFQAYMARARVEATQALQIEEPIARHNALVEALNDVLAAETYYHDDDSRALYRQITAALDELDGVQRLAFQPVSDRLPPGTVIKRLLVQGIDMYALDATGSTVYHLQIQGQHYVLDNAFQCHNGLISERQIDALVDIALLPSPRSLYKIVGIDTQARGVLCAPGESEEAIELAPVLPKNWQQPAAIGYQTGELYVLDPPARAVEIVGIGANGLFNTTPYHYFSSGAPAGIESAIDMAIQRGGLYLLHQDGQITRCQETGDNSVHCVALPYNDTRPGRSSGPVIPNTRFTQIRLQSPPDPSLYALDVSENAIYRFSLQLQFVTQYRPQQPLEANITAFAIDPSAHRLFIAAGRYIYQAPLE